MWFKVDDNFITSPKFFGIPKNRRLEAIGLWTTLGVWCAANETDGKIPTFMIEEYGADQNLAELLVYAGLWEMTELGYQFHDWADWQPTKAELDERRAIERERKAAWRAAKAAKTRGKTSEDVPDVSQRDRRGTDVGQTRVSPLTRPDPTRPLTEGDKSPSVGARKRATRLPEDWILTEEQGDWAVAKGLPPERVLPEAEKFKDYWLAKSGKEATKVDWDRTWYNWVRTAIERLGTPRTPVRQQAVAPPAPRYPKIEVEPDWKPIGAPPKTREEIEAEMRRLRDTVR